MIYVVVIHAVGNPITLLRISPVPGPGGGGLDKVALTEPAVASAAIATALKRVVRPVLPAPWCRGVHERS
ncbi:unnamed protein product [Fusarium venenatum]|uniref:Uncharacterized protein n=1 Tax=Fusarium venenatum TaxID=56646 RepID=A0A2L2TBE2_9HYPO|nr:uncharacterized protein FVRRES_03890 [Fusarium venenatum]CEI67378.1 unnamed protein product [Fusarium venenatum]